MPLSLADFAHRWKINALSERSGSQSHFIDLCDMLGQPHPAAADAVGERFTFEKPVSKVYGGKGSADVWLRDHFAWEYKGKHKDLRAAYKQLNDYREELGNPPLLVVCDMDRFEVHTNFTATKKRIYAFDLDDLKLNQVTATCPLPPLEVLRALFDDYNVLRPDRTDAYVTQEAAKRFARLAERLEIEHRANTDNPEASREQIAHFLMRLLFCLFADSVGLLPDRVFRRLVEIDRFYPRRFLKKLPLLFSAMSEPDGIFGEHTIRWFNGGLFDPKDSTVIQLDKADMGILYEVAHSYDWSHVAPAIFGTLFERSLDPARRSLIGAHYTSEEDILLLIEPVVMRPLRQRWETLRAQILETLELEKQQASASSRRSLLQSSPQAEQLLASWFDELSAVRILDPACGSGNFLYVALRRLLDLWKEARDFAGEHNIQLAMKYAVEKMISPSQLFGIETEFYAHELASIVVWIGFLQWKHDHGVLEDREPILEKLNNIEHADAILRYDAEGKPYEPQWPKADFIIGNPPFLGGKLLRRELGDRYVDDLFDLYRGRVKAESDLVVYWFEKARAIMEAEAITNINSVRIGLLATQGIRGGANRNVLERILSAGNIFWAVSDRNWLLDGANVHVSMIAFERGHVPGIKHPFMRDKEEEMFRRVRTEQDTVVRGRLRHIEELQQGVENISPGILRHVHAEEDPITRGMLQQMRETQRLEAEHSSLGSVRHLLTPFILDGQPVPFINPDLTTGSNTASALRLKENQGICFMGTTKVGPFDIDAEAARKMLSAPINPNGRPNSDVVRPWVNALDITRRPRDMFIIDFGTDMTEKDAALYEIPFEYVRHHVKPVRRTNNRQTYADNWWIHGEARGELRRAVQPLARFILTPGVSKHRLFIWTPTTTIPDHAAFAFARDDDYFFGVLHSTTNEIWALKMGTQLESRPRYTPDSTFDTFPFPWPPGIEPSEAKDPHVKAIADAARELAELRDKWLNPPGASEDDFKTRTLTKLYNERPEWLAHVHRALDEAVFAAYGWPADLAAPEILARLLALNHERAAAEGPAETRKPRGKAVAGSVEVAGQ